MRVSKRIFDLVVVGMTGIVTIPLCLLTAVIVWLTLGRPILFSQSRPGLNGDLFTLRKFRTMHVSDPQGEPLSDEARLTRTGSLLRSLSLDELPELWNVMLGEMSLVGPRPLLPEYLSLYSERQARRHEVMPGLTGWAQVNGRNAVCWSERFEMDIWYVENQSFWLDLRILVKTLLLVLSRKDISEPGEVTMTRFQGNDQ